MLDLFGIKGFTEDIVRSIIKGYENIQQDMINSINNTAPILEQSPSKYSPSAWDMVTTISNNVILVVAGLIFAYLLTIELIEMITQKNNYHEIETFQIFVWILKIAVGVMILRNYLTIVSAIFDIGGWALNKLTETVNLTTKEASLSYDLGGKTVEEVAKELGVFAAGRDYMITMILSFIFKGIGILINVVVIGRFFEIYLYSIIGTIPLATLATKEYRSIGLNFIKNIFALSLQGLLIIACLAIYIALTQGQLQGEGINAVKILAFGIVLVFTLFKTKSIAQSVLDAR